MRAQRSTLTLLAALAALPAPYGDATAAAAPAVRPSVLKVEPPSWWPRHTLNPVRLLVRGRALHGARIGGAPGLEIGTLSVNAAGTYAFVDVVIDEAAAPGPRSLRLTTPAGSAELPFEVLAPLPPEGRFQGFTPDDAIYLIMPDRFANGDPGNDDPPKSKGVFDRALPRRYHGGDLQGVIDRLPYLKDLGITAVWLNPWYDNTDRLNIKEMHQGEAMTGYHGYHAEDFYAVDEHLGDVAKLRELVDEAHAAGLKVIQDQVANHTGPYHVWLQDPPTPTWFNGSEARHSANTWQTWTFQDPYSPPALQEQTLRGWFVDVLPDLNQDDPECARYIIQNTLWWAGVSGLDGIRQDTLPYVHRRFWRDWMAAIKAEHPRLTVVGELLDADPTLVSFYQGGVSRFDGIDSGVDTLFDFPLYYAIRGALLEGRPLREVPRMLARDNLYPRPQDLVTLVGLHDVSRFMGEPAATRERLKLGFALIATLRGIPLVYYGDEIGLPGGGDPDNRRDFPGGWRGDARDAFTAAGRTPEQQDVFAHVRTLLRLRRELPALRRGATTQLLAEEQQWAFARTLDGISVVVAINNGDGPAELEVRVAALGLSEGRELEDRLGGVASARVAEGRLRIRLGARGAAILVPR
ncbi:MAG: alpha-amylase family glycosyl hydrolase [Vicinamibacteria bacterium]